MSAPPAATADVRAPRRGVLIDAGRGPSAAEREAAADLEELDLLYRSLCAVLYNYVPLSGHPGGSISSGRIVGALCFETMAYDMSDPDREDADVLSYAAGHKALGLYAMGAPQRDRPDRRAPSPARRRITPASPGGPPWVSPQSGRTRAARQPLLGEGAGRPSHPRDALRPPRDGSLGRGTLRVGGPRARRARRHGDAAPRIHVLEGEAGLTPGRVAEALAAASTAGLSNVVLHVDWNQASIDSNHVCGDGDGPGDYVAWSPVELLHLHGWNVVVAGDGLDLGQVLVAQRDAAALRTTQPTAIVYRTVKGFRYGIEGRASHGAGHKLCSAGFYEAMAPFTRDAAFDLPSCGVVKRCVGESGGAVMEECFWEALMLVRARLEAERPLVDRLAARLCAARDRLDDLHRCSRPGAPRASVVFDMARGAGEAPPALALAPGTMTTLRGELGRVLGYLNRSSGGALFAAAADLLGSTSIEVVAEGFDPGYFHSARNPASRLLSAGGICEDAMSGILCGLSSFGHHIGAGASYAAFLAPLGHVAMRLHAIGAQALRDRTGAPLRTCILVCAHAGLKTGEDGPTHADPQALQLLQDNFPRGASITLTPWEPSEIWTLVAAAMARRPAILAPFVTRPAEVVIDRPVLGLAPASAAARGVYVLRDGDDGTIVLQGSGVGYAFVQETLPRLEWAGIRPRVYYIASAELFDLLPEEEQRAIYPEERAREALGITDFTLGTMLRWVSSERGRKATLHPFAHGRYLGSGPGARVMAEAGLDGESQFRAIASYLRP
ncbi:MAG: hypothetical protein U0166_09450 [Acidobacteriota bacterium]